MQLRKLPTVPLPVTCPPVVCPRCPSQSRLFFNAPQDNCRLPGGSECPHFPPSNLKSAPGETLGAGQCQSRSPHRQPSKPPKMPHAPGDQTQQGASATFSANPCIPPSSGVRGRLCPGTRGNWTWLWMGGAFSQDQRAQLPHASPGTPGYFVVPCGVPLP